MGKKKVIEKTQEEVIKEENKQEEAMAKASKADKVSSKKVEGGFVYVSASFNNTIVSVTDRTGNVLAWATAGSLGFSLQFLSCQILRGQGSR